MRLLLLILIAVTLGAMSFALRGSEMFGLIGFFLGGVAGFFITFAGLFGLIWFASLAETISSGMFPYLPPCGNGKCKSGFLDGFGDYEPERSQEDWGGYFRCKCSRLYQLRIKEGRVLEILPDGTVQPYMIARPFRGWTPEKKS